MQTDNSTAPTLRAYSVAQAARLCGVSRFTMHRYVQLGRIKAVAGFGRLKISDTELNRFLNTTEEYRPRRAVAVVGA
jgi:excisionase family DNA binding protein